MSRSVFREVGHTAGHIAAGAALFLVLLIAALAVGGVIDWLTPVATDPYILGGLKLVKRVLFTLDAVLVVVWFLASIARAIWAIIFRRTPPTDDDPATQEG